MDPIHAVYHRCHIEGIALCSIRIKHISLSDSTWPRQWKYSTFCYLPLGFKPFHPVSFNWKSETLSHPLPHFLIHARPFKESSAGYSSKYDNRNTSIYIVVLNLNSSQIVFYFSLNVQFFTPIRYGNPSSMMLVLHIIGHNNIRKWHLF